MSNRGLGGLDDREPVPPDSVCTRRCWLRYPTGTRSILCVPIDALAPVEPESVHPFQHAGYTTSIASRFLSAHVITKPWKIYLEETIAASRRI